MIITAHRFSSVVNCDEILYMKDGEITERGTFQELMALGGSFAHVYSVQQEQQDSVVDYDSLAKKQEPSGGAGAQPGASGAERRSGSAGTAGKSDSAGARTKTGGAGKKGNAGNG